jgi:hypothetical protein
MEYLNHKREEVPLCRSQRYCLSSHASGNLTIEAEVGLSVWVM